MMITAKQISDIAKQVNEQGYDFDYVGLRVQESDFGMAVGMTVEYVSNVWVDGEQTDDCLDGVCAVDAKLAAGYTLGFGAYIGDTIVVLGSNSCTRGEDDGEIIMRLPVVIDIIRI